MTHEQEGTLAALRLIGYDCLHIGSGGWGIVCVVCPKKLERGLMALSINPEGIYKPMHSAYRFDLLTNEAA